ncbi:hypothetical protein [Priestia megaterium]|jgi:hypothetical protein|uniref:hypothetical protein n=1 Tax=Priestia megaterium TaxID=1404 RepID=UPI000BF31E96|nr:hypothetical protein [Priestia megaterium]MCM3153781.1 hypothetical protein [Priestia megaterium]MDC7768907.1 hypothetical protein [Priestia megaterium]PEU73198.1 hypothetical protein CN397_00010 [Priestia megaterium]PFQ78618.1 hypothetical protein COK11_23685 [Priestia megaterium]PFW48324.1 hypothetical protein COL17_21830 [Priestia megaterium]
MKNNQVVEFPNICFTEGSISIITKLNPTLKTFVLSKINRLDTFGFDLEYIDGLKIEGDMGVIKSNVDSNCIEIIVKLLTTSQIQVLKVSSIPTSNLIGF